MTILTSLEPAFALSLLDIAKSELQTVFKGWYVDPLSEGESESNYQEVEVDKFLDALLKGLAEEKDEE